MKLGQKSVKTLVGFLGDLKTPKIHSEINWPLVGWRIVLSCLIELNHKSTSSDLKPARFMKNKQALLGLILDKIQTVKTRMRI